MAKILIINDDENICYALCRLARRMDHEAECAVTLKEGLEESKHRRRGCRISRCPDA